MQKPRFIAIAAVSIDGKIAGPKRQSTDWTSKEDKVFLHDFLDRNDVILVGRTTYEIARKSLSKRNCIILTSRVKITLQKNTRTLFCNPKAANILSIIQTLGYKSVAVLGGQKVYNFCLKLGLLDEIYLTIEPVVFGAGLNLFDEKFSQIKNFKFISSKKLNKQGSFVLHYRLA